MKKNFVIIFLITVVLFAINGSNQSKILSPGYENKILAMIGDSEVTEFEVFGIPGFDKQRKKLSSSERKEIIENYILDVIFQTEGNIPEIKNTSVYKKTYSQMIKKSAVDKFRENLIRKKFLTKENIDKLKSENDSISDSDELQKILLRSKSKEVANYINLYLESLKETRKVRYNEKLFDKIKQIKLKDPLEFADSLKNLGSSQELVSYNSSKATIKDLINVVKKLKPYHIKNLRDKKILKSLVDGKILNEMLSEEAEDKGYYKDKEVIESTVDKMKYLVASEYKKRIFNQENFKPSKEELVDYYIEHKNDSELRTRRKMWTFEIFKSFDNYDSLESNDKIKVAIELENVRQKVLNGESFEKYAKFYSRPHTRDGELGYIYQTDYAMIGKTANKLKVGEISDLIIQEKAISVIKVTDIKEPMLYKFDYVEEIVKKRVIEQKRDKFKKDIKLKLFKKYKVKFIQNT